MSTAIQPQTTPTSTDACLSIVHSLMFYMQGGESETFSKKAIESLVKKLKEKGNELDSLITAVTTNGARPTKCVTIPRTLDGRLQVAGRKGFPHVIYARIWRWPDLHKNELKHTKECQYAFDLKQDSVCINPYHYDRVICPGIDLSGLTIESSLNMDDYSSCKIERPVADHGCYSNDPQRMLAPMENGNTHPGSHYHLPHLQQYNHHLPHNNHHQRQHLHHTQHQQMMGGLSMNLMTPPPPPSSNLPYPHHLIPPHNGNSNNNNNNNNIMNSLPPSTVAHPPAIGHQSVMMGQSKQSVMEHTPAYQNPPSCNVGGAMWNNHTNNNTNGHNSATNHGSSNPGMFQDCINMVVTPFSYPPAVQQASVNQVPLSLLPPPEFWCTISYFELDQQVGETFKVPSPCTSVTVDGYTDPSSRNRFCLGKLSNVHRTEASERARLYIGRGVELNLCGEGDVFIKCLGNHHLFVKSFFLDMEAGRAPGKAVHKVYPNANIKVFDLKQCYLQIRQQTANSLATVAAHAAAVSGSIQGIPGMGALTPAISLSSTAGVSVDELRKLCVLQLSFVKGWGPDYPRLTIKETPCWIEIQLHRPLQLLDELLQSMPLLGHGDQRRRPGTGYLLP